MADPRGGATPSAYELNRRLLAKLEGGDAGLRRFYAGGRAVIRAHCKAWYGYRVAGEMPDARGSIIVSNHVSVLDCAMIASIFAPTQVHFLSQLSNGAARGYGWIVRDAETIFAARDIKGLRSMIAAIRACLGRGDAVCIYPEGNRQSYRKTLDAFQPGAFRLATLFGAPVVPVTFVQAARRGISGLLGRPSFDLHVDAPLQPDATLSKRDAAYAMERQVRGQMEAHLAEQA